MVSFFYFRRVWFGQTTRRSICVQQKAHEGVAAYKNSTVRCFSDSNGLLPREFEPDRGSQKTDCILRPVFFILHRYGSDRRHAAAFLCNKKRTKGLPRIKTAQCAVLAIATGICPEGSNQTGGAKKTDYILWSVFLYCTGVVRTDDTPQHFCATKSARRVAALRNSTVRCFSDSNGHMPREFEPDRGSQEKAKSKRLGFFNEIRLRE